METTVQVTHENGKDIVVINGPINEEAEIHLPKLVENLGNSMVINFKQVTYINSLGVRAWINFIRDLGARKIVFQECTPEIVNQINMIPNFKGQAKIESVYGTYFCDDCSTTQAVLFEAGKNLPTSEDIQLPPIACKNCGAEGIEFEEVEEAFFAFSIAS
jgi:anti-anti-sigma regulatory factor/DNA-directed RNA polymerase subunit RPC12/RpoP